MDIDQDPDRSLPSSPPKPLRIRKQPSPAQVLRPQHPSKDNKAPKHSNNPSYPPRTSSLRKDNDTAAAGNANYRKKIHSRQRGKHSSTGRPTPSSASSTSISGPSIGDSAARSTVSSYKERYLSSSTDIIGDFVPVNADMALPTRKAEHQTGFSDT
jgi:hypothetical protein